MVHIYIISKMWIDPMENHYASAKGYKIIGATFDKRLAEKWANSKFRDPKDHPWPLEGEETNDAGLIPVYKYRAIPILNNVSE